MSYAIYILASKPNGTLYIGMTNNLQMRLETHKNSKNTGFTKKYQVTRLVHVEWYEQPGEAIAREKQLKAWRRKWKISLIEDHNPTWKDLSEYLVS